MNTPRTSRLFLFLSCLLAGLAGIGSAEESSGGNSTTATESSSGHMLGLGGRITWMQRPLDDPRLWLDGHLFLQPLPRLFLEGGWGKASQSLRGSGSDTSYSETRWDLALGIVLLSGTSIGYVPLLWRNVSQRHSRLGDASWTELGVGAGALVPIRDWLSLQTETMWVTALHAHRDVSIGSGRESDGNHLELSFSFLIFVK